MFVNEYFLIPICNLSQNMRSLRNEFSSYNSTVRGDNTFCGTDYGNNAPAIQRRTRWRFGWK